MPLTDAQKKQAALTIQSVMGHTGGRATEVELYESVLKKLRITNRTDLSTNMTILNTIRSVQRTAEAGRALQTGQPAPFGKPPRDPSLIDIPNNIGYKVRVDYLSPDTGERYNTVIIVGSDVPLSREVILMEAADIASNTNMTAHSPRARKPEIEADNIVNIIIISSGRRDA